MIRSCHRLAITVWTLGLVLAAPVPALAGDGKALYEANCQKCHGADGKGDTPMGRAMKAASLVDPKWASAETPDNIVSAFRENPKHKAIAAKVSDDDLRAIAPYLGELASAGE